MSKAILWKQPDGTVRIIHPVSEGRHPGEKEADWLARVLHIALRGEPDIRAAKQACEIIDTATLPTDRRFRDAWRHDGGKAVAVDVAAAKEVRRAELNREAEKQIEALSKELARAEDDDDTAAVVEIRAARKALREVSKAELPADLATLDRHEPAEITAAKAIVKKRVRVLA